MTRPPKVLLIALPVGAFACAALSLFLYYQWWVPNQRLKDPQWWNTASNGELKEVAQRILTCPVGGHHDAFLLLSRVGDAESIPYLLWGLRWLPDTPKGGFMSCTKSHCLEALRRITGHDAGLNYSDWAEWWASTGSKLPRTAFPLNDQPVGHSDR
jgi:hypothetical protein